jgi:hypothetical protein
MIIWDEMGSNHRDIDQAADRDEEMNEFHDGEIFKGKGDWRQHSQLFLAGNLRNERGMFKSKVLTSEQKR